MNEAWAVVAAALGSATLTIAGTFWLEQWRLGRAGKATHHDRLREACVQMGAHALSFALRAQTLYLTAILRSGIGEGLDIVLHHRKPVDPMELADWLAVDLKPMLEAQCLIEATAGEELVRAAADLVLAAMAVLEKASSATSSSAGPDASSADFRLSFLCAGTQKSRRRSRRRFVSLDGNSASLRASRASAWA